MAKVAPLQKKHAQTHTTTKHKHSKRIKRKTGPNFINRFASRVCFVQMQNRQCRKAQTSIQRALQNRDALVQSQKFLKQSRADSMCVRTSTSLLTQLSNRTTELLVAVIPGLGRVRPTQLSQFHEQMDLGLQRKYFPSVAASKAV